MHDELAAAAARRYETAWWPRRAVRIPGNRLQETLCRLVDRMLTRRVSAEERAAEQHLVLTVRRALADGWTCEAIGEAIGIPADAVGMQAQVGVPRRRGGVVGALRRLPRHAVADAPA
jgi:hypothetical protein